MKLVEFVPPVKHPLWTLCRQMGIEDVVIKVNPTLTGLPDPWRLATLKRLVDGLAAEGLRVVGLEGDPFDMAPIKQFGEAAPLVSRAAAASPQVTAADRERALARYCELLESMAALDIRLLCYNFMVGPGWSRTGVRAVRGGALATYFNKAEYEASHLATPNSLRLAADQVWANYERFVKAVMPTAEKVGVRMALHPDDPCLPSLGGYARIFGSVADYDRAYALYPSPSNAVTFCQANFKLMGADLIAAARHFGQRIAFIHVRDVEGDKADFTELFHDQGTTDQFALMRTYRELGLDVPVRGDHVPEMAGDRLLAPDAVPGYSVLGRLFANGYLKALLKGTALVLMSCLSLTLTAGVYNVVPKTGADRPLSPLNPGLREIGRLRARSASEVGRSNWTIGCEVLDRDFANFWEYCDLIEPLGIKTVRLQAGWAKCEPRPGAFDFAWLDKIVDYLRARDLDIILETSYGNPIYPGAGGWDLSGGIPTSAEGLRAWDNWVDVLSRHFGDRIAYWAMWNEPDNNRKVNTPARVAAFNLRTAKIIRRNCPTAKLQGLSLGGNDVEYFEACLKELAKTGDVDIFDTYIYHGYELAPEVSYPKVEAKRQVLAKYSSKARLRQGENGCPSEMVDFFALWNNPWTEYSQAKWNMRRMLGDLGHGYECAVYTMSDFRHRGAKINSPNNKGLVRANANRETIGIKRAYYAVQNVAGLFDAQTVTDAAVGFTNTDITVAYTGYRKTVPDGRAYPLVAFWTQGHIAQKENWVSVKPSDLVLDRPGDSFATRPTVFDFAGSALADPVWVDLLTGRVYALPKDRMLVHSAGVTFVDVPVYDSPVVLTERAALSLDK